MPHVAFHTFPVPDNSSPAFSTPCSMVPIFPVLHFPPLQFGADNSSPAFSSLAFSAPPFVVVAVNNAIVTTTDEKVQPLTFSTGHWNGGGRSRQFWRFQDILFSSYEPVRDRQMDKRTDRQTDRRTDGRARPVP